jgi:hypothetical protein
MGPYKFTTGRVHANGTVTIAHAPGGIERLIYVESSHIVDERGYILLKSRKVPLYLTT